MSNQDNKPTQTTFEEACRCPRCDKPGRPIKKQKAPGIPGALVHTIQCQSSPEACKWGGTTWLVQTNRDGSVPPPSNHLGKPKLYVGFEGHDQIARDIRAALEADAQASIDKREIRRRGY